MGQLSDKAFEILNTLPHPRVDVEIKPEWSAHVVTDLAADEYIELGYYFGDLDNGDWRRIPYGQMTSRYVKDRLYVDYTGNAGRVKYTLRMKLTWEGDAARKAYRSSAADIRIHSGSHAALALIALLELDGTHPDRSVTTDTIAEKVNGKYVTIGVLKKPISQLRKLGLIGTRKGANGGIWLTHAGIQKAKELG